MMMNWFVLTLSQKSAVEAFNGTASGLIDARAIDNATPGAGINLNDAADAFAPGDPVTLTGMEVVPKRVVDDPDQAAEAKALLLTLPWCSLENETIFAPPSSED
ncbi:MAG: hypothetical protein CMH13_08760 [Martelella sp.]|uniref:hypothetical protein n=1 Tax=unclassified Martelella TaxID=2629616 RepID=UPI000C40D9A8|nr:hypothetical protein [Martelella sp.]MAU20609.1 hypothetical protein [Martelella sp.]|tara:strand:- start:7 stop:318 length:312 start_codon:yes stop_codon:yes gene_type:complete